SLERALAREAVALFRELPRTARSAALLCTDLHAGNVLAATREQWLVIDPKPFSGDPAFDAVQHMLNCDERLASDPVALAARMASLLDVDPERVRLWLFARCAQESAGDPAMLEARRRLGPGASDATFFPYPGNNRESLAFRYLRDRERSTTGTLGRDG